MLRASLPRLKYRRRRRYQCLFMDQTSSTSTTVESISTHDPSANTSCTSTSVDVIETDRSPANVIANMIAGVGSEAKDLPPPTTENADGEKFTIPEFLVRDGIRQRVFDGYVSATDMCKKANKLWGDYHRLKSTKEFLNAFEKRTNIQASSLISSGTAGTWVTQLFDATPPKLPINLLFLAM